MISSIGYAYADYGNASSWGGSENCISCCETDCCCTQGFISADLLYWRAFENGLDVCVPQSETNTVTDGTVASTFKGRARDPRFNWDPGFRLGAGFNLGCSNLDVAAYWTHFYSNSHGGRNRPRWKIHFDTVDVIAGYECSFCAFT